MNLDEVRKTYSERRERNKALVEQLKKQQLLLSLLRLALFVGGVILSVIVFRYSVLAGVIEVLLITAAFIFLVLKFSDCSDRISFTQNLFTLNDNEINALDGDYSAFADGSEWADNRHDFSGDIDLFGEDSLFRYLNRTVTGPGKKLLAEWLMDPFSLCKEITARQEALRELLDKLDWRQTFLAYGLDKPLSIQEITGLEEWLNQKDDFFSARVMKPVSFIFPAAAIISLLLAFTGILPYRVFLIVFAFNISLIGILLTRINKVHSMVTRKEIFLSSVENLIRSFKNEQFKSSILNAIQGKIYSDQNSAANKIRKLKNLIRAFDSRLNLFVGFILNGLLLWDFHCIIRLEEWRASAASDLPVWLNLIGEIDAFNSLAGYAWNNPENTYPLINEGKPVLDAIKLGHPLLDRKTRVDNNFTIDHSGLVVIITGANMAGKSTFLRTVSVNLVLAMIGAPVCAERMSFTPIRLFTSMRTTDSLSRNESYFYAELKRLKSLKERLEKEESLFFILDEILKGTNSSDKSTGSKLFMKQLIELGATGLIATHDISLGEMEEEFPENVVNKCFEIEINGENISFDYILRDGITRKMNAVVLMKQMGIA
ncbi:MAG: hypothetical protein Q8868_02600 [Bacteroidota bacterium]|nr:hypothetical protein [Bacteroidota bacterium]